MKMTDKKYELVIFDFDGTLVETREDIVTAINAMFRHISLPVVTVNDALSWIGYGARNLIKNALKFAEKSGHIESVEKLDFEEVFEFWRAEYMKVNLDKSYVYSGVINTLNELKIRGYKLAIATNKPSFMTIQMLPKLFPKPFFEIISAPDVVGVLKPDPQLMLYICKKLRIAPEQTLMVGDLDTDILGAKNAGIDAIGVKGYRPELDFIELGAFACVEKFSEILQYL